MFSINPSSASLRAFTNPPALLYGLVPGFFFGGVDWQGDYSPDLGAVFSTRASLVSAREPLPRERTRISLAKDGETGL